MAHMVETMAYVGETPWHGLGKKLEKGTPIETFLKEAGLDWEVVRYPVMTDLGKGKTYTIPNRFAYHRSSDKSFLTMSRSADWTPVQNKELMEFFREYVEAGGASLETAGSLRDGREVWALADLNAGWSIGKDRTKGYLLMTTRHEVGTVTQVKTVATRVVCNNTIQIAKAETGGASYVQNHMSPFNIDAAREEIALAREEIKKLKMDAQTLSDLKMSEFDNVRLLAEFFQPIAMEEARRDATIKNLINDPSTQSKPLQAVLYSLKKAPGAIPDNGWGTLNAVTHYFDHVAGQDRARFGKIINGSNEPTKDAVRSRLLAMAS